MPEYPREIEVERVMNVVRGFGWDKVKEEVINEDLFITIKKKIMVTIPVEEVKD